MIGRVDAVYFAKGWNTARGCKIERRICEEYGVKILDYNFLEPETKSYFINKMPPKAYGVRAIAEDLTTKNNYDMQIYESAKEENIDNHIPKID